MSVQIERITAFLLVSDPWFWDTCTDKQAEAVLDSSLARHVSKKQIYEWLREKED